MNFFAESNNEISNGITFEKIISIKPLNKQRVYDLNIENTHNFIANDIIAHNTGSDGNTSTTTLGVYPNISINTSGLVLLMYFNNETGENGSLVKDWSFEVNIEYCMGYRNCGEYSKIFAMRLHCITYGL